jgi:hypothetical protein
MPYAAPCATAAGAVVRSAGGKARVPMLRRCLAAPHRWARRCPTRGAFRTRIIRKKAQFNFLRKDGSWTAHGPLGQYQPGFLAHRSSRWWWRQCARGALRSDRPAASCSRWLCEVSYGSLRIHRAALAVSVGRTARCQRRFAGALWAGAGWTLGVAGLARPATRHRVCGRSCGRVRLIRMAHVLHERTQQLDICVSGLRRWLVARLRPRAGCGSG